MTATEVPIAEAKAEALAIGRAAGLSAVLVCAGTGAGFVRDLLLAHHFGAGPSTDAFLVSWTVPETVSPLLIEDAMALIMVPAVTRAMLRPQGVSRLVRRVVPRLVLVLSAMSVMVMLLAPWLVRIAAPGVHQASAVTCLRLTAVTVLTFGVAGLISAILRPHGRFGPPAAIYLAYNVGILTMLVTLAHAWGITSAALGVACGSLLMVLVQLPAFIRVLRVERESSGGPAETSLERPEAAKPSVKRPRPRPRAKDRRVSARQLQIAAAAPIVTFTLIRQAQVLVERFFGSSLPGGTISHLNYAQKVAQVPMVLALLIATVTFPRLVRAHLDDDGARLRQQIEGDLTVVALLIIVAITYLWTFAPLITQVMFQHGEFSHADAMSTAAILRVYSLGLLAQCALGVSVRALSAGRRPSWRTPLAMLVGLSVTFAVADLFSASHGATALAAGNAIGISVAAALHLFTVRQKVARIRFGLLGRRLLVGGGCALAAGAAAAQATRLLAGQQAPIARLAVGGAVLLVVMAAALVLLSAVTGGLRVRNLCVRAMGRHATRTGTDGVEEVGSASSAEPVPAMRRGNG
ncbi:murein biosynthesis integral membrane protein MurJ [Actinomadura rupiterrae]|uniref:murein biosynthesis integral membrane protein MurJ n=1 Tax=Actinomadura rupiterrae TaxID=559627 RepID=UPI0020A314B6|nr:lipid II flippase MurJ [Actinomadura rupiterrae]MCP2335169.1 putative peptidoglycan lipid II flippase [Actinomadura rupiterrae]